MNFSAKGLRVLITAGAAGLGHEFSSTFAEAGAKVFMCDVDSTALSSFRAAHPRIGATLADVAIPDQVEAMFEGPSRS